MTFAHPERLFLLVAALALVVGYVLMARKRSQYAVRLTTLSLLDKVAPRRPGWRRHVPAAAFLLMLGLLMVGFAQPSAVISVPRDRATVMLAIDVSNSMEATDVEPTRLAAAQKAATQFVEQLPKRFNVGLVAFAQSAAVVVPPTQDHAAVTQGIAALRLGPSTAIGEAVFASLQAIQMSDPAADGDTADGDTGDGDTGDGDTGDGGPAADPVPARIVLMSDGTTTAGRTPEMAAAAATAAGIPVSTIAYGTSEGQITLEGEVIRVPVDADSLARLAQATGGQTYTAASGEELSKVYDDIGSSIGSVRERREVTAWFIGAALLAALAAAGTSLVWFARLP